MRRHRSSITMTVSSLQFLMVFLLISRVTSNNITADQQALLALKGHITHDPAKALANNWSTSSSVCSWIGVTCGARHRRVVALDISFLSLTGTIPPQLGTMSFLAKVKITNNSFYGSLPDELAQLRRLKVIDFSFNNFNSEIPLWFGSFPKLQGLSLKENNFVGKIPKSLDKVTSLLILDLSKNQLSGSIPSSIFNVSSLQKIDLSDNQLSGSFPSIFFNMPSLKSLDFVQNGLSGEVPAAIFDHLPSLELFLLSINKFDGEIPATLSKCKKLQYLSLSYNYFTGAIPKEIGNMTKLKMILLGYNKLGGEIPDEIGNLRKLEILGLPSNNHSGLFPASIFNMSTVKELALDRNKLSGNLPSTIGSGIPELERFYLAGNDFTGTIPASITNMSRLSILDLGTNFFSGSIPDKMGDLRSIKRLYLPDNALTSSDPGLSFISSSTNCQNLRKLILSFNPLNGILPRSIGNLSVSLEYLEMGNCNIRGNIPEEIGNLKNLIALYLDHNEFNGITPTTFGRLQKLQGLRIQNNNLEGTIPDDLCQLVRLADLFLGNNKFSGSIPACLGNLTSIRRLSLASNMLTSIIPSTLWNLKDILFINLSSNSLNGSLPLDIGSLKVAATIDLSRNHLSGGIPTTIGGLKDLQSFSLIYNRLEGPIPESFGGLTNLEFLDLSNNNLIGVIPVSLEALIYLKYLNFSFNKLRGQIPEGGAFANFSAESFVGNLALCGSTQFQVPPCKTSTLGKSRTRIVLLRIVLPLSIVLTIIVLALIIGLLRYRTRIRKLPNDADTSLQPLWRRFSFQELLQATDGFCESNLLGIGSFGSVYKGRLSNGMEIAIKVFHQQLEEAFKSFDSECEVMRSIRHRNLVKIISTCSNKDFKALVLEYMPNGSLEKCLYSNNYFLDFSQRLNIMIDVASALEYLHFDYSTPILHCDLKPSNILLDENMVAHLSDFGIAKLLDEEKSVMQITQTLGTIGYMAPEYGREGKVSRKCDVYSYGILLMETFTRKRPTDEIFDGETCLRSWIGESLSDNSIIEVVDRDLASREEMDFSSREECLLCILNLAMDCTADLPEKRIDMKNVVSRLVKIRVTLS